MIITEHAEHRWCQRFPDGGSVYAAASRALPMPDNVCRHVFSKGRGTRRSGGYFDPVTGAAFVVGIAGAERCVVTVIRLRRGAEVLVRRSLGL